MAMNKREKILAIGAGTAAALFALNFWVIKPFIAQRAQLEALRLQEADDLLKAHDQHQREQVAKTSWAGLRSRGLAGDPQDAERQVLGAMQNWASATGVVLASVRPELIESKKDLREVTVLASASGRYESMIKFLIKLQNAEFPVRVTELQLGTRNENEDIALQVRLSTLYLQPEKKDNGTVKKDAGKKVAAQ